VVALAFEQLVNPPSAVRPNVASYDDACADFSWSVERARLAGLPANQGLNIAYEAVDRHVDAGRGDHVALRMLDKAGTARDLTYAELAELTNRFADVLDQLGVGAGERIFVLLPRVPELHVAVLGSLKHRSVACTLFSAFGPAPIRQRMALGSARVLVTTAALYDRKVAASRSELPNLDHVVIVGDDQLPPGTVAWDRALDAASASYDIPPTDPEDAALLHFTSGTTGTPKGAVHVHAAVVAHHATGRLALDLHPDDVFWCTADPGWVTGTSYGIVSPLTHGVTSIVDEAEFDADRWYQILQDQRVTVWYTAPTAIRRLMRLGAEVAREYDLSHLRVVASVGEPLHADGVRWGLEAFGRPIHDNWWQTETGGIMVANIPGQPIRPGSMGRPLPGIDAAILRCDDDGRLVRPASDADGVEEVTDPGQEGMLALRPGWPSMFRTYLGEPARYAAAFAGGWYLSGDLVSRDADGYYWFVGRADDVIKTAGHLVGPFEVESALMAHPAVAEAGAYGVPDAIAGNVVHAVVVLRPGVMPSPELDADLLAHARRQLGAAVAPRQVIVAETLPRTRSGKIMRRLLRARELGLPEGDTSALETS
jgi:acetyl-CoA synthetase